jgi:nucleotide-binding universal stress UspA family protein
MNNPNESTSVIIPWDFSRVAEYALEHALHIAKQLEKEIILMHVVNKEVTEEARKQAAERLEQRSGEVFAQHGIRPRGVILEGNIFSTISDFATESNALMVIMGTHGMTSSQKLTGSWALKVIIGSKIPFLVVQEKPGGAERFNKIVYPVDFRGECKEILQWAIYLGKYFNSKVFILRRPFRDSSLLKKTNTNINFAVRFLRQNNVEYEIEEAPGKANFDKETLDYSKSVNADLVLLITSRHFTFLDFIVGNREQKMIANPYGISIMCINPHATKSGMGQFMYGST